MITVVVKEWQKGVADEAPSRIMARRQLLQCQKITGRKLERTHLSWLQPMGMSASAKAERPKEVMRYFKDNILI